MIPEQNRTKPQTNIKQENNLQKILLYRVTLKEWYFKNYQKESLKIWWSHGWIKSSSFRCSLWSLILVGQPSIRIDIYIRYLHRGAITIGMGKSQIRFTETFNVFRVLKRFYDKWELSNVLKLYIVEVCFYLTCKFVTIEENKMRVFGFLKR